MELQGKKWVIENQRDNQTLIIEDANIKQTAYVYKCERSTLQIKGKVCVRERMRGQAHFDLYPHEFCLSCPLSLDQQHHAGQLQEGGSSL